MINNNAIIYQYLRFALDINNKHAMIFFKALRSQALTQGQPRLVHNVHILLFLCVV